MCTHVLCWGGGTCCPHFQPSLCILKFRLPKWGLSPVSRNGFWGLCLLPHQTLSFSIWGEPGVCVCRPRGAGVRKPVKGPGG